MKPMRVHAPGSSMLRMENSSSMLFWTGVPAGRRREPGLSKQAAMRACQRSAMVLQCTLRSKPQPSRYRGSASSAHESLALPGPAWHKQCVLRGG